MRKTTRNNRHFQHEVSETGLALCVPQRRQDGEVPRVPGDSQMALDKFQGMVIIAQMFYLSSVFGDFLRLGEITTEIRSHGECGED